MRTVQPGVEYTSPPSESTIHLAPEVPSLRGLYSSRSPRALPIPGRASAMDDRPANAETVSLIDITSTSADHTSPRSPVSPRSLWMDARERILSRTDVTAAKVTTPADVPWSHVQGHDFNDLNRPAEQTIVQDDNTLRAVQHLLDDESSSDKATMMKPKSLVLRPIPPPSLQATRNIGHMPPNSPLPNPPPAPIPMTLTQSSNFIHSFTPLAPDSQPSDQDDSDCVARTLWGKPMFDGHFSGSPVQASQIKSSGGGGNSTSTTTTTAPNDVLAFPSTRAQLAIYEQLSATLLKHYPPPSLLMLALSKQWKARHVVLSVPVLAGASYLHIFKSNAPDERELERLAINERSVVFVNDEDVGGRRGVVRVGGVDVGALRRDLNGEENGMTMMMLQILDANESQNWINAIKNVVLGQRCAFTWPLVSVRHLLMILSCRSIRAGLGIPSNSSSVSEPRLNHGNASTTGSFGVPVPETTRPPSSRPNPEEVLNRLEASCYFPDHDLDKPVIEASSGGTSPTAVENPPAPLPYNGKPPADKRSRHKKSIRVVAEEHNLRQDTRSRLQASSAVDVLMRGSPKLWGSRVEEDTLGQISSRMPPIPDSPSASRAGTPAPKKRLFPFLLALACVVAYISSSQPSSNGFGVSSLLGAISVGSTRD